ncbi:hypothetical protein DL769_003737 [Monosporascus sp. CRB-8-3]|nr:hypothetical protein DL769_003737 [Monosporascus sp. CRB-8-3]
MFGGLVGYAAGHIGTGLPRWILLFLSDLPSTVRFRTPRERAIAIERGSRNRQDVKNQHSKKHRAIQCLKDREPLPISGNPAVIYKRRASARLSIRPNSQDLDPVRDGRRRADPQLGADQLREHDHREFRFYQLGTKSMQIPEGAMQLLALISGGVVCTRWPGKRCVMMMVANTICITGAALLMGFPDDRKRDRLVALWLRYHQGLGFSMSLTMVASNIAARRRSSSLLRFCLRATA